MSPLSSAARRWLLEVARAALAAAGSGKSFEPPQPPSGLPASDQAELQRPQAAFVSLHQQGRLRGCVGHTSFDLPLLRVVSEMAQAAACEDTRFDPVGPDEIPQIQVEISLLSTFFPILPEQVVAGTHGLLVRQGRRRALLLPQVALDCRWDAERFLRETCLKAGLPANAWKHGATLEAFTAEVITETEPPV